MSTNGAYRIGEPENTAHTVIAWIVTILSLGYMLPWAIGATRHTKNAPVIGILSLLFGWSGVGWIGLLVWACIDKHKNADLMLPMGPQVVVVNQNPQPVYQPQYQPQLQQAPYQTPPPPQQTYQQPALPPRPTEPDPFSLTADDQQYLRQGTYNPPQYQLHQTGPGTTPIAEPVIDSYAYDNSNRPQLPPSASF